MHPNSQRYKRGIPDLYRPVLWRRQPWSSNRGIWVFADHTRRNIHKQNAFMIFAHIRALVSWRTVFNMCVSLQAQTAVDAGDLCTS